MKRVFALIFLLFFFIANNGQGLKKDLDSLFGRITVLPSTDTTTINLRNDYTKKALFANPADSTLTDFAQQTLEDAGKIGYQKGVMLAYERLALISQYS